METLETERLVLRPFTEEDLDFLVQLHADPIVARYLNDGKPSPPEQTAEWLERTLAAYQQDVGHLAAIRRSDGALVGRSGLYWVEIEQTAAGLECFFIGRRSTDPTIRVEAELGYTFARSAWGEGYATEAASRIRDHAFEAQGFSKLISLIHTENTPSARVAERLGSRPSCEVTVQGQPAIMYELRSSGLPLSQK